MEPAAVVKPDYLSPPDPNKSSVTHLRFQMHEGKSLLCPLQEKLPDLVGKGFSFSLSITDQL
jgi:hypothetical protein